MTPNGMTSAEEAARSNNIKKIFFRLCKENV
jgi:hypothetical protein